MQGPRTPTRSAGCIRYLGTGLRWCGRVTDGRENGVAVVAGVVREVSEVDFDRVVREAGRPVLAAFFATWCGNCRRLAPVLDRLAGEYAGLVEVVKVDAEASPTLTAEYEVSSTPTLIVFEQGEPVARAVGWHPEQAVRDLIAARLAADPTSWMPGEICTLPSADRPLRLAQFDDLFAAGVQTVDRIDATRLRLRLHPRPEVAARAADLAVRETGCCGFFTFTLTAAEQQLRLEVSVPESRTAVLDGLAARATAGGPP